MSPLRLRADFNPQTTRSAARRSKDGPQVRRLLALAAIYDGATRIRSLRSWNDRCALREGDGLMAYPTRFERVAFLRL